MGMDQFSVPEARIDREREKTAHRRLNIGCGMFPLLHWTNLDSDETVPHDIHASVPPIPYEDESLDEIYAGHVVEHMDREQAIQFVLECRRCLRSGGRLGIVVPDFEAIVRKYIAATDSGFPQSSVRVEYANRFWSLGDLNDVCAMFIYSTVQTSRHQWAYDINTLRHLLLYGGFEVIRAIDRYSDPRIPVGTWYQCGWDAVKP